MLATAGRAQRTALPSTPDTLVDGVQLLEDLRVLSSDEMQGRETGTPGAAKARAYILERFKAVGVQPIGSAYTAEFALPARRGASSGVARVGTNVIGRIVGRLQPLRHIVVSAHYDHVGVRGGRVFNGANDNASGTAALFALGRYFSAHRPANSLILAAFDAEELGLVGAEAFLRSPPVDRKSIVLNVNADMVGRDRDNILWVSGASRQPFLRPYLSRVAARAPVALTLGHDDPSGRGGADWMPDSDQWVFFQAGVPALYVGVEDREEHHQPTDDYDNMTHRFFVNAVETIRMLVEEFDAHLDAIEKRQ
jgi:Zn-dependent M28 family amino/carboxypeptidase